MDLPFSISASLALTAMINRVVLTADEINCVVYAYLQEAGEFSYSPTSISLIPLTGFTHSAFSLRQESHIGQSPLFKTQIPRGELVDLLTKALRYIEVETHAHDLDLAQGCTGRLTLMRPHVCSLLPQPAEDELEDTRMEEPISQEASCILKFHSSPLTYEDQDSCATQASRAHKTTPTDATSYRRNQ